MRVADDFRVIQAMKRLGTFTGSSSVGVSVPDGKHEVDEPERTSVREARIPERIAVPRVPSDGQRLVQVV